MRIGIVCPYSFDAPGGVQFHIRDHAEHLISIGHEVSVLAPAEDGTPIPDYVVPAGRTIPFRYNASFRGWTFAHFLPGEAGPCSATEISMCLTFTRPFTRALGW